MKELTGIRSSGGFVILAAILLCCPASLMAQGQERKLRRMDSLILVVQGQQDDSLKALNIITITGIKMDMAQNTGNWDDPIAWAGKGLEISKKSKYNFGTGRCYWQLGVCWIRKSNYANAIGYFLDGVRFSVKNGNNRLRLACYNQLADCYLKLANYHDVINISQSAIDLLAQMTAAGEPDNGNSVDYYYLKMGDAYHGLNKYPEALGCFEKAQGNRRFIPEEAILFSMASAYMAMKDYQKALNCYLKSLQLLIATKDFNQAPEWEYNGHLGNLYKQIGEVYYWLGKLQPDSANAYFFRESIIYLEKSLPLLETGAMGREVLMEAYRLLIIVNENMGDYKSAIKYNNLFVAIKDSLYNKETYLQIADQQLRFEREKAAAEQKAQQAFDRLLNDKLLADQRVLQERKLAEERLANEKAIATQKLLSEKALTIAGEKANYEKVRAVEKVNAEKKQVSNRLLTGLLLVTITAVFLILFLRQKHQKDKALQKAEAFHKMAELELQSLRSQLNPHFMFNALNSIQTLIMKEEADTAQAYLSRFARLLRMLLENADRAFIPLSTELEVLRLYLALEHLRVPDMQYVILNNSSINPDLVFIPNMMLQPYVENAIWHGLTHKASGKQLEIRIMNDATGMIYEIEDNGIGREKAEQLKSSRQRNRRSKGMELLMRRIQLINEEYDSVIKIEVSDVVKDDEVSGTLVLIIVPMTITDRSNPGI